MKKLTIFICLLFMCIAPCFAKGIENGRYEISFTISDMGFTQIIEIRNSTQKPNSPYYKFDVIIKEEGSLKTSDDDNQIIKGIVFNGHFKFIIPCAYIVNVEAYYFDGKISLCAGTHTHVQTADEMILPNGTGYVTDLGICGGLDSVIGMKKEDVIKKILNQSVIPFSPSAENLKIQGIIASIDINTRKTVSIKRIME